jgi:hypothetical protein
MMQAGSTDTADHMLGYFVRHQLCGSLPGGFSNCHGITTHCTSQRQQEDRLCISKDQTAAAAAQKTHHELVWQLPCA